MKIIINVYNQDSELIGKREALDWKTANEAFGKLERMFNSNHTKTKLKKCEYCQDLDKMEREYPDAPHHGA